MPLAWAATLLVVGAAAAHVVGAWRARRDGSSVASSRHLVLLTAIVAVVVAALVGWRAASAVASSGAAGAADPGVIASIGLTVVAAGACVVLFTRVSREARAEARPRPIARDAERGRRADLEVEPSDAVDCSNRRSGVSSAAPIPDSCDIVSGSDPRGGVGVVSDAWRRTRAGPGRSPDSPRPSTSRSWSPPTGS